MGFLKFFSNKKKKLIDFQNRDAIFLDVRTQKEYNLGAMPGAKHIPIDQLASRISEVKKWNAPIIAYCEKGGRSEMAATMLGSNKVEVINGGGFEWLTKNL